MPFGFASDSAKNSFGESAYRPRVPPVTLIFLFTLGSVWSGALVPWRRVELLKDELAGSSARRGSSFSADERATDDTNATVSVSLLASVAYFGGGLMRRGFGYFTQSFIGLARITLVVSISQLGTAANMYGLFVFSYLDEMQARGASAMVTKFALAASDDLGASFSFLACICIIFS
ncbi:unnamed protein product [Prorocentrum cordatum]|uniref:Uncharacterized protein n=1 Tax=Prorocentrum cordatum TaxID=2364126 RepID=A0ABN9R1N7_9DINO|nr:unnamed protein product [Polarella glacialis]